MLTCFLNKLLNIQMEFKLFFLALMEIEVITTGQAVKNSNSLLMLAKKKHLFFFASMYCTTFYCLRPAKHSETPHICEPSDMP